MSSSPSQPYTGKRAFDVAVAGAACLAFAPLAAGVAIANWLEDGGPALFSQPRVGQHRRSFTILKFRTMREQEVTRVGHWLRRTGIDELPQFLNVLRGEMSVVGPRPLTQADVQRLGWERLNATGASPCVPASQGFHSCSPAAVRALRSGWTDCTCRSRASRSMRSWWRSRSL